MSRTGVRLARVGGSGAILAALAVGIITGLGAGRIGGPWLAGAQSAAATIGGLWVDALRMTIVPLIAALLIASVAEQGGAAERRLSGRTVVLFVALLVAAAVVSLAVTLPMFAGTHVRATAAVAAMEVPPIPAPGEWLRALVPTNIIQAAADDRIVSLVLFAILFGAAAARIEPGKREVLIGFFAGVRDAMLRIVGWVLLFAPIGIAALAFAAASNDISGLVGIALLYVGAQVVTSVAVMLLVFLVVIVARRGLAGALLRASAAPVALAIGTRSSLACFPAMVTAADRMGLERDRTATVLSLAVSLFKTSVPGSVIVTMAAMAAFGGHHLTIMQAAIIAVMGVVSTVSVAGLPGAVSFFAVMIPTAQMAGISVAYLPLLLAVDALGDMARTACNVFGDLGAAALVVPVEERGA